MERNTKKKQTKINMKENELSLDDVLGMPTEAPKEEVEEVNTDALPADEPNEPGDDEEVEEPIDDDPIDDAGMTDVEREAAALESDDFTTPKKSDDDDDLGDDLDGFDADDYTNKEKIPEIRKENRLKRKQAQEAERREADALQRLEDREQKVKELEERLTEVESNSSPQVDPSKDPIIREINDEHTRLNASLTENLKELDSNIDLNHSAYLGAYEEYAESLDNPNMAKDVIYERVLGLMGKGDILEEARREDGSLDRNMIYGELGAYERELINPIIRDFKKSLDFYHENKERYDNRLSEIKENSSQILSQTRAEEYSSKVSSFQESLKGVGILGDQELEQDPNGYGAFIHDIAGDPKNKGKFDSAVESMSLYRFGPKPASEQLYEYYDNQPTSKRKTRDQVDTMIQEQHGKKVANMDKKLAAFVAAEDEITQAIEYYRKAKAKSDKRRVEQKKVNGAEKLPSRGSGLSKNEKGSALDNVLGL